jgi:hypothetical protein
MQMRVGTYFETVLRLFRFANQTDGDAYLKSHPPVFYLKATHGDDAALPSPRYKDRVSGSFQLAALQRYNVT